MAETAKEYLEAHYTEHPECVNEVCPHAHNYIVFGYMKNRARHMVTATGFDAQSAIAAAREGIAREQPWTYKRIKRYGAELIPPEMASIYGLPENPQPRII